MWPVYFSTRTFAGSRLTIRKGERLPDNKQTVRHLLHGAGIKNALACDFDRLPVQILDAHDAAGAARIQGKSLLEARRALGLASDETKRRKA